jgi:hypothetical protein
VLLQDVSEAEKGLERAEGIKRRTLAAVAVSQKDVKRVEAEIRELEVSIMQN